MGVGIATVGVGILKEGIRSLWGDYVSTSELSSKPYQERSSSKNSSSMMHTMQTYYNPNSPAGKARHLELYFRTPSVINLISAEYNIEGQSIRTRSCEAITG